MSVIEVANNWDGLCPLPPKTDWSAEWIWIPDSIVYGWRNSYAFFRKRFSASGTIKIDIAADTRYEAYLDGRRIGRGTAPSAVGYKIFDNYNVQIGSGEHVICVLVHHIGEVCATAHKSRPGLLVEMARKSGDAVSTDSTWKAFPGNAFEQDIPVMMSHFGFHEVCDYRQMPEGWTDASFDDSGWYDAQVLGKPGCVPWLRLIPRDIPHLVTELVSAQRVVCRGVFEPTSATCAEVKLTVAEDMANRKRNLLGDAMLAFPLDLGGTRNEFVVLDFGREVTGHVRLRFEGAADGQRIDIGYDEVLDKCGLPNPRRTYVHFADRFYLRGAQDQLEVFDGRGFRYLLIDVPAGKGGLTLTDAEVDERTYPVSRVGHFRCSDAALNHLYKSSLETTRLCMLDTYVDCPSRERVLWMDSYLEGLCSSYGTGITQLWRKVLYLFAQDTCQTGDLAGAVKAYAPSDCDPIMQSYMLYYVCSLCDYVLVSGDLFTGGQLFGVLIDQFSILERFADSNGLLGDNWPNWPSFIDWSAMDLDGLSASLNCIYLKSLQKAARLAMALGKVDVADNMLQKALRLRAAIREVFWSEGEGLFIDAVKDGAPSPVRSQLTNALAIWAGVVEDEAACPIVRRITCKQTLLPVTPGDYRLKPDFKCQTGGIVPIGTPGLGTVLAAVLFDLGMDTEALDYLRQAWLPIARNGTLAEHFAFDANTSMCHGWSATPVLLLPKYVLGVKPLTPGWETVEVGPYCGDLSWAEGSIPTPLGDILVAWEKTDGELDVRVEVPAGMTYILGKSENKNGGSRGPARIMSACQKQGVSL